VDKYELQISGFGWLNWVLTHALSVLISESEARFWTAELGDPVPKVAE
jgi:hypothetical protein